MAILQPPPSSYVAVGDDDRLRRLRFHMWQVIMSLVVVLVTTWIVVQGIPLLGITAVAIAKHVLVAILCMGLDIYPAERTTP